MFGWFQGVPFWIFWISGNSTSFTILPIDFASCESVDLTDQAQLGRDFPPHKKGYLHTGKSQALTHKWSAALRVKTARTGPAFPVRLRITLRPTAKEPPKLGVG